MPRFSSLTFKGIYSPYTKLTDTIILSLTPSVTSVNEGSSVTFTVTTRGIVDGTILYWGINNITTGISDFSNSSGSFSITSNSGSFTVTPSADFLLEGVETFTVSIYSYYTGGILLTTSQVITINDTSFPTYSLTRSVASVNEGSSFTITFATNMSGSFTYTITGITSADIGGASLTGTITNGTVLTYTVTADLVTEGAETFSIALDNGGASTTVLINDTSIYPISYSVSPDVSSINEGSTVTFTVSTVSIANGTTLYWTDSGTGTTNVDFSSNTKSGSFVINSGSGTITRTVLNNYVTDTARSIIINIRTSSTAGTIVATSSTVTLTDGPSLSVAPNATSINEGTTVTYTITPSSYLADGTTLYWSTSGTTVAADFSDSTVSGSFTISGGVGTVNRTLSNDLSYPAEGLETIIFNVRNLSISGTIVATASTVSVADTSIGTLTVSYLVVGGGGAGGNSVSGGAGGGGGAGGYRTGTFTAVSGRVYNIVAAVNAPTAGSNGNGEQSSIIATGLSIIAAGGGAGGKVQATSPFTFVGNSGGSGGGGAGNGTVGNMTSGGAGNTPSTSPSQGNSGGPAPGASAGGCGGGSLNGGFYSGDSTGSAGDIGGDGTSNSINGTSYIYAGGGGGGSTATGNGLNSGKGGNSGTSGGNGGGGSRAAAGVGAQTYGSGGGGGGNGGVGGNGSIGRVIISIPNTVTPTSVVGASQPVTVGNNITYSWLAGTGSITFP